MGSKTPVTVLQELMTQMGTAPIYELLYDGTGSQTPVFIYRVYAKNVSATGSGRTKKEAKHEAALAALQHFSLNKIQDSQPPGEPVETPTSHEYKMEKNAIAEHHKMSSTTITKCVIPVPEKKKVEENEVRMEKIHSFVGSVNKKEIENKVGIKTPVTILQELMLQMGTVPKYDLEYDGTGSHIPVFTYRVHANNVSATGSGRTKREAKQEAALAALECMSLNQTEDSKPPQKPAERVTSSEYKIAENATAELHCATNYNPMPEKELLDENSARLEKIFNFVSSVNKTREIEMTQPKTPVSVLQELMIQKGTPPKYDLEYDGTGSHIPEFRYRVYANNFSATGSGRTKKVAKQEAALAVLECMRLNQIRDSQPPQEPAGMSTARMQTAGGSGAGMHLTSPSKAPYETDGILSAPNPLLVKDSLLGSAARMRTPGRPSAGLRPDPSAAPHAADSWSPASQEAGGATSAPHPVLVKDSLLQSAGRMEAAGRSSASLRMGPSDAPHAADGSPAATHGAGSITSAPHPVLVKDSLVWSTARMEEAGWSSARLRMGPSDAPHAADGSPTATQGAGSITSASHPVLVKDSLVWSTARMEAAGWSSASLRMGPSDAPHAADGSPTATQGAGSITSAPHPVLVKDSLLCSSARMQAHGWSSAIFELDPSDNHPQADGSPSANQEEAGSIQSAPHPALVRDSLIRCAPRMQTPGWSSASLIGHSNAPHKTDGSPSATPEAEGITSVPHPVYLKDSLLRSAAHVQTAGRSSEGLPMCPRDAPHEADGCPFASQDAGGITSAAQPVLVKDSLLGSAARMQTTWRSGAGLRMDQGGAPHEADSPSATNEAAAFEFAPQPVLVKDSFIRSDARKQTPGWSRASLEMGPSNSPRVADGTPSATLEACGIPSAPHPVLVKEYLARSIALMQTRSWSSAGLGMGPSDTPHEADGSLSTTQEAGGITSALHPVLVKDSLIRETPYKTAIAEIAIEEHHHVCAANVIPKPENELVEGREARLEKILTFVSSINKKQEMEDEMGSKTPVSILQEMMTRMGTAPKYDLIFDGSGTHTAEFRYKVYANNVSAIGSGRSKKEAKHEAARIALERLSLNQIEDSRPQEEPVEIVTPYKDKIQENAIGELHDMCATNDIPMPEYELVEEKGAPHEKIFTFVCSVSKQKEIGIGRTKKQAKQLAAYSMMNRLKESLADVLTELKEEKHVEPDNDNFEQAIAKYMATIGTPRRKFRLNRSPSKYDNFFSDVPQDFMDAAVHVLKEIPLPKNENERKELEVDWMLQLTRVVECLNASTMVVPGRQMKNGSKCVFLQINLSTEASFFGTGKNADEAIQEAAYSALVFINIQLRNDKNTHDFA